MAQITIGGVEYHIPEMNFLSIERAWPFVQQATSALDPMQAVSAALSVIASALMEAENFDSTAFGIEGPTTEAETHRLITYFLKKKLRGNELGVVQSAMFEILKEAGLEVTEGEAIAVLGAALGIHQEGAMSSPETAPDTSPSSSQLELKEEAGTP